MKLLAIANPDRYIPVFAYSGARGKRRLLHLLGWEIEATRSAEVIGQNRR